MSEKTGKFTLQKYTYSGWQSGKTGSVVYVDVKHMHPDPSKKLIWGYDKDGVVFPGDYKAFFEKVGKPVPFEYKISGRTAMEERKSEVAAIRRAIDYMER